ncbi:MAG: polyamine ABC transporter ATP-binding protein [Acidiferrobacterales bacterium]|nr:polyamine ABC transporter ATP-binding protein [Acidiferrobacterales bacterium]
MNQPTDTSKLFSDQPWLDPDAEPFVRIRGLTKTFGSFTAVSAVDLDIYEGELFSLLGGSGCGKSTLLRMMAGFESPTSGNISIDGVDMANIPPYKRPVNMMFQSYALFPHMTVEGNVGYGLKQDRIAKDEIEKRVAEILAIVELTPFGKRKPHQLSGGQRQRVALARALVKKPKVLLLDEPLGALDKRLREQTQFELMNIQDRLGITFIVVTHDQEEAMTLSTRIAVMDQGQFSQIGTPTDIYEYPQSRFVANFIGSANMFEGRVVENGDNHVIVKSSHGEVTFYIDHGSEVRENIGVSIALRPEKITLTRDIPETIDKYNAVKGIVDDIGYLGNFSIYKILLENDRVIEITHPNQSRPRDARHLAEWEDEVMLSWAPSSPILLTK